MPHKMNSCSHLLLLLGIAVIGRTASAQSGVAAFQGLPGDAHTYGLAEATVALRGYPGAASINPATIGEAGVVKMGFNTDPPDGRYIGERWIFGTAITQASAEVGLDRWSFGYQYKNFDQGEHQGRDSQNNPTGTFRQVDASHKLVAAYVLHPALRVGMGLNLIRVQAPYGQIVGSTLSLDGAKTAVSVDLGVQYERPLDVGTVRLTPSAGWSLTDFGPRVRLYESAWLEPMHMVMRGGISVRIATVKTWSDRPLAEVGLHGALSKTMVSIDEDGTHGPFATLVRAFDPVKIRTNPLNEEIPEYSTISGIDQIVGHLAVDVSILRILTLRFGRIRENEWLGIRRYDTFGFGVDLYYLSLDYGSSSGYPHPPVFDMDLRFWRVTARIPLHGSAPANFWAHLFKD